MRESSFNWIHNYTLFLFDFDGLLVNTEELHYYAYQRMCERRGFILNWDFARYCQAAHYDAFALREQIFQELPGLKVQEPQWDVLYQEKKHCYLELLDEGSVSLMPGVKELLSLLDQFNMKRCVVTHSPYEQIARIRQHNPLLDTIPYWVTREQYEQPKPHPDAYLTAIKKYATPEDRIIGFEDSSRGLKALMGTRAQPVWICHQARENHEELCKAGVICAPSFYDL